MAQQDEERDTMSREEAGRLGGEETSRTHDSDFYEEIGSMGGSENGGNFKNDPERAAREGRKGGQATGDE
jgi:uncharacterized protein